MKTFFCIIHQQKENAENLFAKLSFLCRPNIPKMPYDNYGVCYKGSKVFIEKNVKDAEVLKFIEEKKHVKHNK